MAIRWRELLDHLHVQWTRHYARRGWISIRCPWCGTDDPSQHLGIDETLGIYHCLRNNAHAGKSPFYLLKHLGVAHADMDRLLAIYGDGRAGPWLPAEERWPADTSPFARRWATFKAAERDDEAIAYLAGRHFWNPRRTIRQYDLRVGTGRWAGRLWFPLANDGELIGYTGRSMGWLEPKYMTETADAVLYLPRQPAAGDRTVWLVEGPFDALRLADAIEDRWPILVAALCGLAITPTKAVQLRALAREIPRFAMTLDSTVSARDANRLLRPGAVPHHPVGSTAAMPVAPRRLLLPPGVDDPGEMTNTEIDKWLWGNQWLKGEA